MDVMDAANYAQLDVTGSGRVPSTLFAKKSPALIGRSAQCAVLLDHPMVSRVHARLERASDGRWLLKDMLGRNGTRVNDQLISEAVLSDGDQIQIGPFALRFRSVKPFEMTLATDISESGRLNLFDDPQNIQSLVEISPPKLAVEQLQCLDEFSQSLLHISDPSERLIALCQLMLHPRFGGKWSVAISIPADADIEKASRICTTQIIADSSAVPRLSRSLLRTACQRYEPVIASNSPHRIGDDPNRLALSISEEVSPMAAVAIPLTERSQIDHLADVVKKPNIEVLCAGFPPQYGTGEWLALCTLAVRHYHHAESIWLNIAKNRKLAAMEAELERAHFVQDRLVPKQCQITGLEVAIRFKPCLGVAGDYVDAIVLHEGLSLLVIADVSGKGLPAALVAMGVHTLVHACSRKWTGLKDLATSVDAHLAEVLPPEAFVSFMAMTIDLVTGAIEVVNAGHPAALVVGASGIVRRIGEDGGYPLGMLPQTFEVMCDELNSGETMLLFTDGCFEVFDIEGCMLGMGGLSNIAVGAIPSTGTVENTADAVGTSLDLWEGGKEPTDDRSLLVVRREVLLEAE